MADEIRTLSEELARDPASLAFLPLGEALRRQGQLDHARKIVTRGLERHPHLADAHDLLARIHADAGEAEKAFDEWDMVRRLSPGHGGAAKGMGFICFNEGRLADAEGYLREALAGAPGDDSIVSALEFVRSAMTYEASSPAGAVEPAAAQAAPAASPPAVAPPAGAAASAPSAHADEPDHALTAPGTTPAVVHAPDAPDAADPRFLFATVLSDDDQTALLLDRDGFVLAGSYPTWDGRDLAQEVGAELSGVSDEATRATRHLGIGAWRSITFEAEAAMVAMAPTADGGLLVLAAGSTTPLGLTRRLLDRCVTQARAWLGGGA